MQKTLIVISITLAASAAALNPGIVETETGTRLVERVADGVLERAGGPATTPFFAPSRPGHPDPYDQGEVLWSIEEWHGSYGAMCEDVDVSEDGNYVFCSWNLNYEKWELYESYGAGTPVWTYDLLDGGSLYVDAQGAVSGDISADGNVIAGCVSGWTTWPATDYKGTLFKFSSASSTPDWSYDFPHVAPEMNLSSRPVDVRVTPDGSTIVCLVRNIQDDPTKPHQLYVFDSASDVPTLIIDLPNTGESPYGLDITDDASLFAYSTYQHVYVYDSAGTQLNSFTIDHGWQRKPAISADGEWLVYGNYHGQLRLNGWNGSEFEQAWQYTIPPEYYYPFVGSVDVAGDTVMMGSYQPNASSNRGFVYVFDTSSSAPLWISDDFGDYVEGVSLNADDATVGIAASWGPISGSGWRSALFMTDSPTPYFYIDESYPGSHFACEVSGDGAIAATGGKRIHARQSGSGGWLYCIESSTGDTDIELLFFTADGAKGAVRLEWGVAGTDDISGFNLYRTVKPSNETVRTSAPEVKLNGEPIIGEGPYVYVDHEAAAGKTYTYRLEAVLNTTNETLGTCEGTPGAGRYAFALAQNYPNPVKDKTSFSFSLPETGRAVVRIYDITGRLVAEVGGSEYEAGTHSVTFDAVDLANGVYSYELEAEAGRLVRKMVINR